MHFPNINSLNISSRLTAGFGFLLILTLFVGGLALLSILNLSTLMSKISDYPFQVIDRAQRIKSNVIEMDRDICDILCTNHTESEEFKDVHAAAISKIHDLDSRNADHLEILRHFYLGDSEDINQIANALDNLRAMREQALETHQHGHIPEAIAIIRPTGISPATRAQNAIEKILIPVRQRAILFRSQFDAARNWAILLLVFTMLGLISIGLLIARTVSLSITRPLNLLQQRMTALAAGDLGIEVPLREGSGEIAAIARATQAFKDAAIRLDGQRWVKSSIAELNRAMQSATTLQGFAQALIDGVTTLCRGGVGIFYLTDTSGERMELQASYGLKKRRGLHTEFKIGEGLVGQAALERKSILLTEIPDDYARITTGIGEAAPRQILVAPIISKRRVLAVIEIGTFRPFSAIDEELIEEILPVIALNLEVLERNHRTQELLAKTQQQAEALRKSEEELRDQSVKLQATNEELRHQGLSIQEQSEQLYAQSEQLRATNEDLHKKSIILQEQTEELRASEEEMRVQREELQAANEELRVQREELQAANEELIEKSRGLEMQTKLLEVARSEADRRALERDTANRYKSEFLSNMSHELRTPLNSLLILARSLRDNEEHNLTEDQVESATIIHDSGSALLRLINDILDLSKVEAGKMEVVVTDIAFNELATIITKRFRLMAQTKGLGLEVNVDSGLPNVICTDAGKLDQILNNLIGNAIKFTEHGGVSITIQPVITPSIRADTSTPWVEIIVRDTGIGIPSDKIESVFNAFEQADGTTSRRYGGTGLGLTISRRLAELLGGTIAVTSAEGQGSCFNLTLPLILTRTVSNTNQQPVLKSTTVPSILPPAVPIPRKISPNTANNIDDRLTLAPGDESILIIEDDASFASIIRDLAHRRGFKCLIARDGSTGLQLARIYHPTGIVLDVGLPDIDGWSVMQQLKQQAEIRHIPVHFISATDSSQRGLEMGAVGYLTKPVTKEQIEEAFERVRHFGIASQRRLLLVEDDVGSRKAVATILSGIDVEIIGEATGEGAIERLRRGEVFDCMILDLGLPGIGGLKLLEQCTKEHLTLPPVIVYSGRDISDQDSLALKEYTDSIVIKGVRSPDRLVDEVTLFLHSVQHHLPVEQRESLQNSFETTAEISSNLAGCTVLVVDDDMRNAFALSKVLRAKGLKVLMAQNGEKAIKQINERPEIDIVLMDIMMPGMDGYTAMQEIRRQERFQDLPIIALTAKAMRGDRDKCIEAGASDYMTKPVDIDALMAMLHVYLPTK